MVIVKCILNNVSNKCYHLSHSEIELRHCLPLFIIYNLYMNNMSMNLYNLNKLFNNNSISKYVYITKPLKDGHRIVIYKPIYVIVETNLTELLISTNKFKLGNEIQIINKSNGIIYIKTDIVSYNRFVSGNNGTYEIILSTNQTARFTYLHTSLNTKFLNFIVL